MNTHEASALADIVQRSSARAFLVGLDTDAKGQEIVTVHAAKSVSDKKALNALKQNLLAIDAISRVTVRRHSERKMMSGKSIETFVAPMAHAEIAFDATGAFTRGSLMTDFATQLRSQLGDKVTGVYFNARWRTLYVQLNESLFGEQNKLRIEDLAHAEEVATATLCSALEFTADDKAFRPSLRLGFTLPTIDLVPVDAASQVSGASVLSTLGRYARVPAISVAIGLGSIGAVAADDSAPAVSELNGKLAVIGSYSDSDNLADEEYSGALAGSVTVPLGHSFGFQADGAIGTNEDAFLSGVGGHLFWRDPTQALVGVTASYSRADVDGGIDLEVTRFGGEAEIYKDQFTFAVRGGHQFGENLDDGFFGSADVSWYATDDLRFRAGAAIDPVLDTTFGGDVEYRPGYAAVPGLAYFADTSFGDDSYARASIGIRFYFGDPDKSLKTRHRYDDPEDNLALDGLNSITAVAAPEDDYIGPV